MITWIESGLNPDLSSSFESTGLGITWTHINRLDRIRYLSLNDQVYFLQTLINRKRL